MTTCCNMNCNQGRDCPRLKDAQAWDRHYAGIGAPLEDREEDAATVVSVWHAVLAVVAAVIVSIIISNVILGNA